MISASMPGKRFPTQSSNFMAEAEPIVARYHANEISVEDLKDRLGDEKAIFIDKLHEARMKYRSEGAY